MNKEALSGSELEKFKKEIYNSAFSNFFDNVTFAVYLMDGEGKFITVNKYAEKMYGYDADYFVGKTPAFLSAPGKNDLEKVAGYLKLAFEGKPQKFNFWGLRKNGEIFYKEVRAHKARFVDKDILIVTGEDLSKQLELEETAQLSEERYKTIIDNVHDAIAIIKDAKIVFANKQLLDIAGYSLDEVLLKPFTEFLFEEDKNKLLKNYQLRLQNENELPTDYTINFKTKNGDIKFLTIRPALIKWGDGKAVMEIINDITDAVKERKEKETLQKIIENSASVLFDRNENDSGYVSFVTSNVKNILGYEKNDLIERKINFFDILLEQDRNEYNKKIEQYTEPGLYHFSQVYRVRKKDGNIIYVNDNTTIEIDEKTGEKRIFSILTDITEKYLLNKKIEEQEKNYRLVIENVHDALIIAQDYKIKFANKYLSVLLEYDLDELLEKPIENFIYEEDIPIIKDRFLRRIKGDKSVPRNYDFRLVTKSGKIIWVQIKPKVIEWNESPAIFAFLRDITTEKETYEQLRKSEFKYRTITENIAEGIIVFNENFELKYFNPAFLKTVGAKYKDEIAEKDLTKFIHPDDVEIFYRQFKKNFPLVKKWRDFEIRMVTLEEKIKWTLVRSIVVEWEGENSVLSIISDITELKENSLRLEESNKVLEILMNSTPEDIICIKDGESRWIKANKADLELFQLTDVDYFGKTDADLAPFSPFYKDAFLTCLETDEKCWQNGVTVRGDEIIPVPNGEPKIYDVIKTPIFNPDGSRKMLIVFGRDVTYQRKAEQKIRESEKQYKTLIENLHESVVVTQKGIVKFFNPSFEELTGYSKEELNEKIIVELIDPEDRPLAIDSNEEGFNMHISDKPYEFRIRRKNGEIVWVLNHAIEIKWTNDETAVMNFIRDITKERMAVEQLNKLSVAVEQSEQGFIILDSSVKIEYANPYICKLFEMEKEDLLGNSPEILTPAELNSTSISSIVSALISEKTWRGEVRLLKKTGKDFWGYLIVTPIKNFRGELTNFLIIIIDIDEIKKIENKLIEAKEAAEKNSKLKSYFLAQMSHEIRTPINAILSFAGLIKAEIEDQLDEDLRQAFISMETAGRRIIRTIDLLLNMSEIQAGTYELSPKKLDLDTIINSVLIEYLTPAKEKNVPINYHKLTEKTVLPAHDEYSIQQILLNIVDNAVKYTDSGQIDITVGKNKNDELFVEVKDTGIGISKEYLKELFTPFTQEEQGYTRKFEGNGLGLALINAFCKLNNAKIDVKSQKGVGSSFTVTFKNIKRET